MLKKILKKTSYFFRKSNEPTKTWLECPSSTILLHGTSVDFRIGNENRTYVSIGERGLIKATFTFESKAGVVRIGNNVHIGQAHFICRNKVEIKDDVTMAWGITLYDHNSHSIYWDERKNDNKQCYEDYTNHNGNNTINKDWSNVVDKPITIESKVWIGYDVTILKGVTIGEGAVIGAKSVVTKDVPEWTVVAGNPAKVVKDLSSSKK